MGQIFLAHSDSSILHDETIPCISFSRQILLGDVHRNLPSIRRVFDRIAEDVENNLPKFRLIADQILMSNIQIAGVL